MIFPILNGLMNWRRAPVAWTLIFMNILMLCYTSVASRQAQHDLDAMMDKDYFITTQGRLYAEYLGTQPSGEYPSFLRELGREVRDGESHRTQTLGQLAFRDYNFISDAANLDYQGDQVAFDFWKKKINEVEGLESVHPSFTLGLKAGDESLTKWITYMFVHSGWLHLFGNMLFLAIFGSALETQIGGLGFLVVYVLSGMVAAGSFALMTGVTSSPLVGASGAISGIMALYCVLNWSKPTRYFYWFFLPFRGFMGLVYLPAWVALLLWGANDLAGYLGTLPELGGVAHTAHLGGEAAGILTGLALFALRRFFPGATSKPATNPIRPPMGVLYPFLPPKPLRPSEQIRAA